MRRPRFHFYYFVAVALFLGFARLGYAHIASSTNYRIEVDSVNVGGILSTSSSHRIEDTLGESGTGTSTSASYNLHAGYQPMTQVYIAISAPSDVTMSPTIPASGGTGNGSTGWTVTTDSPSGYTLSLKAATSPALTSSNDSFSNYIPEISGVPDFFWSVTSGNAEFGFSPEGSHITSTYKDNGTTCATGSLDTSLRCWDAITTSNKTIASSNAANHPSGTGTTVRLRAELVSRSLQAGSYTATLTGTALPQ